jgi:hypothetical protein
MVKLTKLKFRWKVQREKLLNEEMNSAEMVPPCSEPMGIVSIFDLKLQEQQGKNE